MLLDKSISQRVGKIPEILLNELRKMDSAPEYEGYTLTQDEVAVFEKTLDRLPEFLQQPLLSEVFDIYFVKNFNGGGMTYFVWNNGKPKYVLVFNPRTLHDSLSDWLTYRDNSTFGMGR